LLANSLPLCSKFTNCSSQIKLLYTFQVGSIEIQITASGIKAPHFWIGEMTLETQSQDLKRLDDSLESVTKV
jgi:hypothetical protein